MNVTALLFFFFLDLNISSEAIMWMCFSTKYSTILTQTEPYKPTSTQQFKPKSYLSPTSSLNLKRILQQPLLKLVYTSLFISWNSVLWLKLRRQLHTCDSVPNSENDLLTQWRKAVVSFCCVLFKVFDRRKDMIQYLLGLRYYTVFHFFIYFDMLLVHCNKWTRSMW